MLRRSWWFNVGQSGVFLSPLPSKCCAGWVLSNSTVRLSVHLFFHPSFSLSILLSILFSVWVSQYHVVLWTSIDLLWLYSFYLQVVFDTYFLCLYGHTCSLYFVNKPIVLCTPAPIHYFQSAFRWNQKKKKNVDTTNSRPQETFTYYVISVLFFIIVFFVSSDMLINAHKMSAFTVYNEKKKAMPALCMHICAFFWMWRQHNYLKNIASYSTLSLVKNVF